MKNKKSKKGFIYSLDAYIAVIISFIAVYLLVNYSSLKTNYIEYYQAKTITLDVLNIIYSTEPSDIGFIANKLDELVPPQYSYELKVGGNIYKRGDVNNYKKLRVSSSILIPYEEGRTSKRSPYSYKSCGGGNSICDVVSGGIEDYERLGIKEAIFTVAI